jgi:hypothetical protein
VKSIDFVIRKTAAETGIPENKVKVVVMEYWETIYYRLLSAESTTITVRHIGSFTISKFKLGNFIKKKIDKIRRFQATDKLSPEQKLDYLQKEKAKLRVALRHRNVLAQQYADMFDN